MGILIPIRRCLLSEERSCRTWHNHYSDVTMSAIAPQTTGISIVYSIVCSGVDQRKHQSSASLAFVRGIHLWPVNSPHKGPVTRKMLPFDDVIMIPPYIWWRTAKHEPCASFLYSVGSIFTLCLTEGAGRIRPRNLRSIIIYPPRIPIYCTVAFNL